MTLEYLNTQYKGIFSKDRARRGYSGQLDLHRASLTLARVTEHQGWSDPGPRGVRLLRPATQSTGLEGEMCGNPGFLPCPTHADRTLASGYKCSMVPRTREGHIREGAPGPHRSLGRKSMETVTSYFTETAQGTRRRRLRQRLCH